MKLKNLDTAECHTQFGQFIKEARLKNELNQKEVAEGVGITQAYLSYLERGEREIDLVLALRLCDTLNVNIVNFLKQYM